MHLLKNCCASFYAAKKKCHMRKFARVRDPSQKICYTLRNWQWLLRFSPYSPESFLAHRQTSFQHSICCLYTLENIFVTENLPQKICSCRLGCPRLVARTSGSLYFDLIATGSLGWFRIVRLLGSFDTFVFVLKG